MFALLTLALAQAAPAVQPEFAIPGEHWALLIGVNDYEDRDITDLNYTKNDVQAMRRYLLNHGVPDDHIIVLSDAEKDPALTPTEGNIWARLRELQVRARGADRVTVYFSGHGGAYANAKGQVENYLFPLDLEFDDLDHTAIPIRELLESVEDIDVPQRLVILDACRSNVRTGLKGQEQVLLKPEAPEAEGISVLYSSVDGAPSRELDDVEMGLFTYHLYIAMSCAADGALGAPKDGVVTLDEAFAHVRRKLEAEGQVPAISGEVTGDFVLSIPGEGCEDCQELTGEVALPKPGGGCLVCPELPKPIEQPRLRRGAWFAASGAALMLGAVPAGLAFRAINSESRAEGAYRFPVPEGAELGYETAMFTTYYSALGAGAVVTGVGAVFAYEGFKEWRRERDARLSRCEAASEPLDPEESEPAMGASLEPGEAPPVASVAP
ncbi:MAG: caspase family protein [Alphaproteobacteria bacterium]|nr:caspase family protein [Alphaproteobacteria bacterium]